MRRLQAERSSVTAASLDLAGSLGATVTLWAGRSSDAVRSLDSARNLSPVRGLDSVRKLGIRLGVRSLGDVRRVTAAGSRGVAGS